MTENQNQRLLSLELVEPLLPSPLSDAQKPRAEALIALLEQVLLARYGERLGVKWPTVSSIVAGLVAAVVGRKLAKVNELAVSESAGPFSVNWGAGSSGGELFLAAELRLLDSAIGGRGGTRTVRTAAPDGIRYGNRLTSRELGGYSPDVTIGGVHVSEW